MTLAILLSPGRVAFAVAIAGLAAFLAVPAAAVSLEDAMALDRDGFHDEAVGAWKKIIASEPGKGLLLLARLKLSSSYMKTAQLPESVAAADAATTLAPANYDAQFHLANAKSQMRDFPGGLAAYRKAIKIRPSEGLGYVGLALTQFASGDSKSALKTLEDAKTVFKKKRNIQWYQDTRIMMQQIKGFAKYPPNFADLWLENNLRLVRETYEKTVFNIDATLQAVNPSAKN